MTRRYAEHLNIGWYHSLLGDHASALRYCSDALAIQERLDDQPAMAATWDSLGHVHHSLEQHDDASDCYGRALEIYRRLGNHAEEAETLVRLGENRVSAGEPQSALDAWRQALAIFEPLGSAAARELAERIRLLSAPNKSDTPAQQA